MSSAWDSAGKILSVASIEKAFGRRQVLHGVSLDADRGETVGLLGPDGAGKTVTFFSILGLVKINAGKVLLGGEDVSRMPLDRRARRGLGYLPQEASIFSTMTVEENILTVLELFEPDRDVRMQKLDELLEDFHITYVRRVQGRSLSGGERRRCEIARAMAANPAIMLLDEPFAGIDPLSVRDIKVMIRKLKERNVGVLITDQNVLELVDLLDRVFVIHEGHIIFEGAPDAMLEDHVVRDVYLGEEFEHLDSRGSPPVRNTHYVKSTSGRRR
ncbi:lipopolysaccharide export system ATP-binding protein [Parasphingorhabdus marina DSM 22363]|uniref:Lipopolysaccharide export system ATP-binding protein n=2 Tax=Parasphingorhabdus marina TaxID=394732 RepID=A0A1N6CQB0_9SPHN|nr:lipopolysaccharide export system ATP-binding protein [Parasphingorhabdus marina DSM 22363]